MKDKLIEVNFDSLLELEYLQALEDAVRANPDSIDAEPLTYDEHHILLVGAFIARDFLRTIHFPEMMDDELEENTLVHTAFWKEMLEENIISPRYPGYADGGRTRKEPTDLYLREILADIEFKGDVHPKDYPLLTHIHGIPYVPSWFALKWNKRAIRVLQDRIRVRDQKLGGTSDV